MPRPVSRTSSTAPVSPPAVTRTVTVPPVGRVPERVLDQVAGEQRQVTVRPADGDGLGRLGHQDEARVVGLVLDALALLADERVEPDVLGGRATGLEPGQVQEVVHDPRQPQGLPLELGGEAGDRRGVVLGRVHEGLGGRPDRRGGALQLVRGVGHEVAADGVEAAPVRDVAHDQQDARRRHRSARPAPRASAMAPPVSTSSRRRWSRPPPRAAPPGTDRRPRWASRPGAAPGPGSRRPPRRPRRAGGPPRASCRGSRPGRRRGGRRPRGGRRARPSRAAARAASRRAVDRDRSTATAAATTTTATRTTQPTVPMRAAV